MNMVPLVPPNGCHEDRRHVSSFVSVEARKQPLASERTAEYENWSSCGYPHLGLNMGRADTTR